MTTDLKTEALERARKLVEEQLCLCAHAPDRIAAALLHARADGAYRAACVACLYCAKGETYRSDGSHWYGDGYYLGACKSKPHRDIEAELRSAANELEGN
jgi:hypothetical protein